MINGWRGMPGRLLRLTRLAVLRAGTSAEQCRAVRSHRGVRGIIPDNNTVIATLVTAQVHVTFVTHCLIMPPPRRGGGGIKR